MRGIKQSESGACCSFVRTPVEQETFGPVRMETHPESCADEVLRMFKSARRFATLKSQLIVHVWTGANSFGSKRRCWLNAETLYDEHVRETGCGSCVAPAEEDVPLSEACMRSCVLRAREWQEQVGAHVSCASSACLLETTPESALWGILAHSVRMTEPLLRRQWETQEATWKTALWQYVLRLTETAKQVRPMTDQYEWSFDQYMRQYSMHVARTPLTKAGDPTKWATKAYAQSDLQRMCDTLDRALELLGAQTGSQHQRIHGRAHRRAFRSDPTRFRGTTDQSDSTLTYDLGRLSRFAGRAVGERQNVYRPPPMREISVDRSPAAARADDDESDATIPYDIGNVVSVDDDDDANGAGRDVYESHTANDADATEAAAHDTP